MPWLTWPWPACEVGPDGRLSALVVARFVVSRREPLTDRLTILLCLRWVMGSVRLPPVEGCPRDRCG